MNLQCAGTWEKIREPDWHASDYAGKLLQLLMRAFEEFVEQTKLVDDLQRGGVHRVAAEIAQEIGMLFQHDHIHAGAREEEPQHHACRTAAYDAAGGPPALRTRSLGQFVTFFF